MATELFPIIATADLDRSLAFYRDLLGGVVDFEFPGSDGRAVYVSLKIGSSQVGIGLATRERPPGAAGVSLWAYTLDCDALVERLRAAGVRIIEEPADQPWGERVARVADPDGLEVHVATAPG